MKKKCENIQSCKKRSKMLLTVSIVMFQVVPFGLECIVVLVLYLPPGTSCGNNCFNGIYSERMIGDKCVLVKTLSVFPHDGQFTPVNAKSVLTIFERDVTAEAVCPH